MLTSYVNETNRKAPSVGSLIPEYFVVFNELVFHHLKL